MAGKFAWAKRTAVETLITVSKQQARQIRTADNLGQPRSTPTDDRTHLQAAVNWLSRAQDRPGDDGVAAMFSLLEGWVGSYPETTGYIIPTFFDAAESLGDDQLRDRAIRMADWLLTQQHVSGGFPGSFVGRLSPPRVFNTGQIIFGLIRTANETFRKHYLAVAAFAGDWLIGCMDDDGAWRKNTLADIEHTYNVRTAWALLQLAGVVGDRRYCQAALANADWTLKQQCETGWFDNNDFLPNSETATLHTISYTMRGLLEIGKLTNEQKYIDAARRAAKALHETYNRDSFLAGAFRKDWSNTVQWRCIPGEAQLAIVWMRLDQLAGKKEFKPAAEKLLEKVKASQFMDLTNPDFYGAISGSVPINGGYERYCLVNWGPKFLIDALVLKGVNDDAHPTG